MRVPGSPFSAVLDHPFAWYARVRDKKTGKEWTYWINGVQLDRQTVADFVAVHYPNVEAIEIQQCTTMPTRALQPVPREHYGVGALEIAKRELSKLHDDPLARSMGIKPIGLSPIKLQPLTPR